MNKYTKITSVIILLLSGVLFLKHGIQSLQFYLERGHFNFAGEQFIALAGVVAFVNICILGVLTMGTIKRKKAFGVYIAGMIVVLVGSFFMGYISIMYLGASCYDCVASLFIPPLLVVITFVISGLVWTVEFGVQMIKTKRNPVEQIGNY